MNTFEKVIGYKKEKEELFQICDMAQHPEKYAALGVKLPRGILLYGVPGVGKTLMATALVEEMGDGRKCYIVKGKIMMISITIMTQRFSLIFLLRKKPFRIPKACRSSSFRTSWMRTSYARSGWKIRSCFYTTTSCAGMKAYSSAP